MGCSDFFHDRRAWAARPSAYDRATLAALPSASD